MDERYARRRDPLADIAGAAWSFVRATLAIVLFGAAALGYFVAPFLLLGAVLILLGGMVGLRLLRRLSLRAVSDAPAAAGRALGRGALALPLALLRALAALAHALATALTILLRSPLAAARAPLRGVRLLGRPRAAVAARAGRLVEGVHWTYSLLALTAMMVLLGLTLEAVGWETAAGASESAVRRAYWSAGAAVMLGFLLLSSRSLRRTRTLEHAVAAHSRELVQAEHSRREAEERFQTLAATSPDGIAVISPEGNVLLFNEAICELFGYTTEEMQQLHIDRLVPAEEQPRIHALRESLLNGTEQSVRVDTRQLHRDGHTLDVEFSAFPFHEGGRAAGLLIELRDITARTEAEAEAEREALRHAALAELGARALRAPDLEWLMGEATALVATTLDVEFCALMELAPGEQTVRLRAGVGWPEQLIGHALEPAGAGSQAGYALAAGEPVSFDDVATETRFEPMSMLRAHGVASGVSVAVEGADAPFGLLGAYAAAPRAFAESEAHFLQTVANVLASAVERAAADRTVRESEERFRRVLETAHNGLMVVDERGRTVLFNHALCRMLGYSIAEMRDRDLWSLLHADDRAQVTQLHAAHLAGNAAPDRLQARILCRDGDQIEVEGTASAYEEGGRAAGVLYELQDVTQETRLRERLLQAEKSEALGTLVSGVAHDFNNLLTVIAGGIEVEMQRGDGQSRWLQSAHVATERAEGIVLQFSRRGEPTRIPVDLAALARETVSLASETFDRRIELTLEAASGCRRRSATTASCTRC